LNFDKKKNPLTNSV